MRNLKSTTLIFELSNPGRRAARLPECDVPSPTLAELLPADAISERPPPLPEVAEPEVVRHFTNLSTLKDWPLLVSVVIALTFDVTSARSEIMIGLWLLTFSLASIGMFMYFVMSKYGQRLGDKLANTLVIEDRSKADFHKTIYLEISDHGYQVRYPEVMRLTDRDINGIRNLLDVKRITKEHEAYMQRISDRITEVLGITTEQEPYDFLAQLLRDYNFLTSK